MIPYNYKAELIMLNIERNPNKINEIIQSLKSANKELKVLIVEEERNVKK